MINKVEIEGTLTQDIELKMTQNNKCYARFTLANKTEKWTNYIKCVAWEETANELSRMSKDDHLHIKGYINTGSYTGKQGKVYTTDIVVSEILQQGIVKETNPEVKNDEKIEPNDLNVDDIFY